MGFFKEFKDDFSQAVNELMPDEDSLTGGTTRDDMVVNTLEGDLDVAVELSKLDSLLEQVASKAAREELIKEEEERRTAAEKKQEEPAVKTDRVEKTGTMGKIERNDKFVKPLMFDKKDRTGKTEKTYQEEKINETQKVQEEKIMAENTTPAVKEMLPVSDEVSVITKGMIIKGDIITNGSLDIQGEVYGNVDCNGKLVVTGTVKGNSNASEMFADAARVEGEIISTGTVKIGLGSVIIGNVTSTSAVVAGAIKGDIDVQGPVVVDTSAVVMGNIKSRSVQINNGAVIEGYCSQSYADIDVKSLFESKEGK